MWRHIVCNREACLNSELGVTSMPTAVVRWCGGMLKCAVSHVNLNLEASASRRSFCLGAWCVLCVQSCWRLRGIQGWGLHVFWGLLFHVALKQCSPTFAQFSPIDTLSASCSQEVIWCTGRIMMVHFKATTRNQSVAEVCTSMLGNSGDAAFSWCNCSSVSRGTLVALCSALCSLMAFPAAK